MALVAFVTTVTQGQTFLPGQSGTISRSTVVAAGESLVVALSSRGVVSGAGVAYSGVTFNGKMLTFVGRFFDEPSRFHAVEVWYIRTPTPATANVVATYGGGQPFTVEAVMGCTTYTNFPDISTPISLAGSVSSGVYVAELSLTTTLNANALAFAVLACGQFFDMTISSGTERYQVDQGAIPFTLLRTALATITGGDVTITYDNPVETSPVGEPREGGLMVLFSIITPPLIGSNIMTTGNMPLHLQRAYLPGKGKGVRDLGGLSLFGRGRKKRGGVRRGRI